MKFALTKKTWVVLALMIFALAALPAQAADFPVSATLTLNPDAIAEPGTVTAQIQVTNISGADMTRPVSLYDPYGKLVSVFGKGGEATLKKDASTTVSAQVRVSQEMLDQGQVTFTLHWQDDAGREVALPVVGTIGYSGETAGLRVMRYFTPQVVRSGQTVRITYELTNTGETTINTVTVQEKLVKKPQTIRSLAAGDTQKVEFSAKMGSEDLISGATITYRVSSGSPQEKTVMDDLVIPVAVKNLSASLSLDRTSVDIGQNIVLTLTITNGGNITYSNVTATDKNLGTIFEGLEILPGATVTESKELTVTGPASYQLKLNLNDNTGMTNSYDTNTVSVSAFDPEKELLLTLLLTSDKESIVSAPEQVAMTLVVTNTSNVDCRNVSITHAGVQIYTIPILAAGQSVTVKRDYMVSQAGQFRFKATTKDTVNNTVEFESNTLSLSVARQTPAPTPVPTPTIAPLVTLEPVTWDNVSQPLRIMRNVLYTASWVLGIAAAAVLLLFLISTFVRAKKKHDSNSAYDHLDLAEKRDYSQPADEDAEGGDEEPETASSREEMPETDEPADQAAPDEQPDEAGAEEPAPAQEEDQPGAHTGGFKMTRDTQTDEFPVYEPLNDAKKQADEALTDAAEAAEDAAETVAEDVRDVYEEAPRPEEKPEGGEKAIPDRRHRRSRRS